MLVVLVIVAAFLGLGWWQATRAVTPGDDGSRQTETARPLTDLLTPDQTMNVQAIEQRATVSGTVLAGTATIVSNRTQQNASGSGEEARDRTGNALGYWVVVGLLVDAAQAPAGAVLPVALGWSPDLDQAQAARDRAEAAASGASVAADGGTSTDVDGHSVAEPESSAAGESLHLTGRIMPFEGVEKQQTSAADYLTQVVSGPELINVWQTDDRPWFEGYLVVSDGVPAAVGDDLQTIYSPPPSTDAQINWMNIFYAAEWAVFAAFALFLWWRLGRDEYEHGLEYAAQEREQLELLRRVAVPGPRVGGSAQTVSRATDASDARTEQT
nr:SURF1 family cytochrome oxidase biogenesis protein [Pseudoclavibacter sp. 13-3]